MTKFGELTFGEVTFGEMTTVGEMTFGDLTFGEPTGHPRTMGGRGRMHAWSFSEATLYRPMVVDE